MEDLGEIGNYPWRVYTYRFEMETLVIEEGVTSIGSGAFLNCNLSHITIPSTVVSIGKRAIHECSHLAEICLAEGNPAFKIVDGALLDKAGTTLIVYPAAGLIHYFHGKKLVLINMSATSADSSADLVIHEKIGEVFAQVMGWK